MHVTGAPDIAASPASTSFGLVYTGLTATRTFTVANVGTAPLNVSSIVTDDAVLTASPGTFTVPLNGAQTVTLTYAPTVPSSLNATVTVNSDDPDEPVVTLAADRQRQRRAGCRRELRLHGRAAAAEQHRNPGAAPVQHRGASPRRRCTSTSPPASRRRGPRRPRCRRSISARTRRTRGRACRRSRVRVVPTRLATSWRDSDAAERAGVLVDRHLGHRHAGELQHRHAGRRQRAEHPARVHVPVLRQQLHDGERVHERLGVVHEHGDQLQQPAAAHRQLLPGEHGGGAVGRSRPAHHGPGLYVGRRDEVRHPVCGGAALQLGRPVHVRDHPVPEWQDRLPVPDDGRSEGQRHDRHPECHPDDGVAGRLQRRLPAQQPGDRDRAHSGVAECDAARG